MLQFSKSLEKQTLHGMTCIAKREETKIKANLSIYLYLSNKSIENSNQIKPVLRASFS